MSQVVNWNIYISMWVILLISHHFVVIQLSSCPSGLASMRIGHNPHDHPASHGSDFSKSFRFSQGLIFQVERFRLGWVFLIIHNNPVFISKRSSSVKRAFQEARSWTPNGNFHFSPESWNSRKSSPVENPSVQPRFRMSGRDSEWSLLLWFWMWVFIGL